jgi:hypothetical protein
VNLILLHGAVGIWDEVACLAIPATAILGVALAVLREKPAQEDDADTEEAIIGDDDPFGVAMTPERAQSER